MKIRISQLVDSLQPEDIHLEEKPFDRTSAMKGEVYRRIRRQAAEKPVKRRRMMGRLPLAAAIALICLATTAAAAVTVHLNPAILEYFGVGEGQESLVEPGTDSPVCSVTKDGVTISVLQTVADSFGVYVFYEVTVPEEITLPDWVTWECFDLEPTHAFENGFFCSQNQEILEVSDHHVVGAVALFSASEQVEKGPITVLFRDLGYYDENGAFVPLAQGQWTLTWTLNHVQACVISCPEQRIQTENGETTVHTIAVSSISFNLTSDGAKISEEPISLQLKDGSTLPVDIVNGTGLGSAVSHMTDEETEQYACEVSHLFAQAIDPAQVTAVIIGDTVIPFPGDTGGI